MPKIPYHVAIIPDGNRRWAKERGLPSFEGHRRGFDAAKKISRKARELGIKVLTLWAFSTENWNRSKDEVNYLMGLYEKFIDDNLKEAMKDEVRIIQIGRKDRIPENLRKKIINAEEKTSKFHKHYFVVALDYGGHDELLRAIQKMQKDTKNITEKDLYRNLDTKDLPYPNVDLIIRTSGEMRTSGYLIWQATYAEFIFIKKHFPDFTPEIFEECIREFSERQRRFGK